MKTCSAIFLCCVFAIRSSSTCLKQLDHVLLQTRQELQALSRSAEDPSMTKSLDFEQISEGSADGQASLESHSAEAHKQPYFYKKAPALLVVNQRTNEKERLHSNRSAEAKFINVFCCGCKNFTEVAEAKQYFEHSCVSYSHRSEVLCTSIAEALFQSYPDQSGSFDVNDEFCTEVDELLDVDRINRQLVQRATDDYTAFLQQRDDQGESRMSSRAFESSLTGKEWC